MNTRLTRRAFLGTGAIATGYMLTHAPGSVVAMEPFKRPGSPRLLLSLAAYSFRNSFQDADHPQEKTEGTAKKIDLFQFIDFCADHGCAGTELTSYYFPKNFDEAFLLRLKRHGFLRGIAISGTAVGNTFTNPPGDLRSREIASVKKWIDRAQILGAPHIRVFAGNPDKNAPDESVKQCIAALEECGDYAGTKGIVLGLENHGGIVSTSDQILRIIKAVKSPWLGINLDTGNFHAEDPYEALAKCAPYAVNVQVKVEVEWTGHRKELTDLPRLIGILKEANYQGYVALEYEAAPDPWKAVPEWLEKIRALL